MKNTKKIHGTGRFLSLLLALCMILTFIPTVAFANNAGEMSLTCQSNAVDGGRVFYKLNNTGEFAQVFEDNTNKKYGSINLGDTTTSITIKLEPKNGYELDTVRGVTLRVNGSDKFNSDDSNIAAFTSESGYTFNLSDLVGEGSVSGSSFELEFGFGTQANPPQGNDTPGELGITCQSNAVDGGRVFYKLNNTGEFAQVFEDSTDKKYGSIELGDTTTSITIKLEPKEGYELDTVRGVTLRVNGNDEFKSDDSNIAAFTSESGYTFNLSDLAGEGTVSGSTFSLEFGFGTQNNPPQGGGNEGGGNEGGNQNSNVEVQFDNATISGNVVTFNVDGTDVTLTVNNATISDGKVIIPGNDLGSVTFIVGNSFNAETMQITVRGAEQYDNVLKVDNKVASLNGLIFPGDWLHLEIEAKGGGDNPPPGPGPGGDPAGGTDNIELEINFTGTSMHAWINNKNVDLTDGAEFKGTINGAGTNDVNETNVLRFQEDFGFKPVTEFVINGVAYKEGMEAVKIVEGQGYFITVPGASKYTIAGAAAQDATVDRTIIWANVGANEDAPDYAEDMLLKHGSAKIIAVYAEDGRLVDKEEYLGRDSDEYGVSKDGLGWAKVVPGSKVVFEFVPEYGYQLTSVKSNGFPLEPQKTINQYTFTMPDANVHFAAEFTKTADELKADSKKVASGSISLGNKLEGGSAQLTVSDATLSSDKIAGFENAAGEYTISDYLDIDLYNVFYKGKDDADDVWSNKIDELDEYATISIKLEDGVNADDIVIVHNLHDGDKYEIINIDSYDPATNTITFKTKSFSAYAIATKGLVKVTKDEITNAIKDANNASKAEVLISVPKDQDVSYIELPVASVKEVANGKKGLTIETKTATVTLDSKALETIAGKADGENITLNLVKIAKDDLNEKQQKAIKGINVDTILSAEILCGDKVISKDFGGGKATVKLPFTAAEGKKLSDYTIVYIADDGKMLRVPTKVVDGNLVFEIEHFSEYAVALSSEVANIPLVGETPKTGDATNMMPWLGLMAITGAAALVLKRKED